MSPFPPAVGQANDSFVSLSALHLMSDAVVFFPQSPFMALSAVASDFLSGDLASHCCRDEGSPSTPAEHPGHPKPGALEAHSHLSPVDLGPPNNKYGVSNLPNNPIAQSRAQGRIWTF